MEIPKIDISKIKDNESKKKYFSIGMIRRYLEDLNLEEERIMYVYHYLNNNICEMEEYKNILEFMNDGN